MSELQIDVEIDGEKYSQKQLGLIQHQRTVHVLHELKYLGAQLRDGERELSHEDINWLPPARADEICCDVRFNLGEAGSLALFSDVLLDSERRWKKFNAGNVSGELRTGQADLVISGVTMQEFMGVMAGEDMRAMLSTMPEHYAVSGSIHEGQRIMEVFGMFGEPAHTYAIGSPNVPHSFPIPRDPAFPIALFGELKLRRDDTPINVGAFHQFRPLENGFVVRSIFFCPKTVPQAMVDGHKIHFALELSNAAKAAYAKKSKTSQPPNASPAQSR